jgi:hypothetical protein
MKDTAGRILSFSRQRPRDINGSEQSDPIGPMSDGVMLHKTRPKFTEHCMITPYVSQLETQEVFPVNPTAHRIGCLTIGEVFSKL